MRNFKKCFEYYARRALYSCEGVVLNYHVLWSAVRYESPSDVSTFTTNYVTLFSFLSYLKISYLSFNFLLSLTGCPVGNILAIPITGMLAKYGFDGGWPSVFYCFGKLSQLHVSVSFTEVTKRCSKEHRKASFKRLWCMNMPEWLVPEMFLFWWRDHRKIDLQKILSSK